MKSLLWHFIIITAIFSMPCQAQLLEKIIKWPGTGNEVHWNFNTNGQLTDIRKPDNTVMEDFTYDANGNLMTWNIYQNFAGPQSVTHTFTYDANNRISSFDGIPVDFDPETNQYTYTINGNQGSYVKYYYNVTPEGLLIDESREYYFSEGDVDYDGGVKWGTYADGNLISIYAGDFNWQGNWYHVGVDNPLRPQILPVSKAALFAYFDSPNLKMATAEFVSTKLESNQVYGLFDPEEEEFYYELNSSGKPYIKHRNLYYFDDLEYEQIAAIYYYYPTP